MMRRSVLADKAGTVEAEHHWQVENRQIVDDIVVGALGEKLPSVRELSTQLTINPNTIQRAYRELETEGYICSVAGRGSYVCAQIPDDPARQAALLQQFDAAVQELLYLGMRSEELRRRIPEGGTNHD